MTSAWDNTKRSCVISARMLGRRMAPPQSRQRPTRRSFACEGDVAPGAPQANLCAAHPCAHLLRETDADSEGATLLFSTMTAKQSRHATTITAWPFALHALRYLSSTFNELGETSHSRLTNITALEFKATNRNHVDTHRVFLLFASASIPAPRPYQHARQRKPLFWDC